MKLTTKSEYSLLALICIARNRKAGFVKTESISSECDIPKGYLEQLLLILKQNRYLKARRGSCGGYDLALPPTKISIAQIIRLMDGALAPTGSVSTYFFSHTPLEQEKKVIDIFKEIRNFVSDKLERVKLSDLI
ncbi:MAG: Rrf2 family transcriptional regulator [Omnitrophica bacterium RBG_13_46_9]|nr:MAG: Rrf2 family transcriptional regulator [Omnitrophica bacterium RBG_13_46_9]